MEPLPRDAELTRNTDGMAMLLSLLIRRRHNTMMRKNSRDAKLIASVNLGPART